MGTSKWNNDEHRKRQALAYSDKETRCQRNEQPIPWLTFIWTRKD